MGAGASTSEPPASSAHLLVWHPTLVCQACGWAGVGRAHRICKFLPRERRTFNWSPRGSSRVGYLSAILKGSKPCSVGRSSSISPSRRARMGR